MAAAVLHRPYRGSRVASFYPVKSLPPLAALDSAFQLQEYISLLIRRDVHDVDAIVALPGKTPQKDHDESLDAAEPDAKRSDDADRKSDVSVDSACWIYEQLRRLAQDLSHPLITMLQQECTRSSCPQMKAGEWLYLCVAHGNDGAMEQCCAIDYILHTLDSATALLNSPRAFPSRLSIPPTSHRHFASLARRLGRVFAHAYFHHREAFEQAEAESSLYARFLKLTHHFDLVPPEFLVIPERAIHADVSGPPEQVEPPRLFSAAVHPTPNLQNDTLTASTIPDIDQASNGRPRTHVDATDNVGTDSPRKLGRSRTDTMVFSEAFSAAEEPSRTGDGGSPLSASLGIEAQSLAMEQPWTDLEIRTEDLDDEDIGDARSELTLTGSLSPPVEALSLISLEDAPAVTTPDGRDAPSDLSPPLPLPDTPAANATTEEPAEVINVLEEHGPSDDISISETVEPISEEAGAAVPEVSAEPTQVSDGSKQDVAKSASENEDSISLSSEVATESGSHGNSELSPPPEPLFEISEPPPSEPIPPENESDITDEVGGHDEDEVRESGAEAVVGE